jgi:tetratricopeptide (TPR) repeat protein
MTWARARIVILAVVVAIFAHMAYSRGFGMRLGGAPASLEGPYSTEEAWIIGEIVSDIAEMSSFPATLSAAPAITAIPNQAFRYRVSAAQGSNASTDLDLTQDVWAPESFVPVAAMFLGSGPADVAERTSVHPALLELTPATLVTISKSVSNDLSRAMRNPATHEAAALTIGAFALREAAARFHDVRWSLNRMTAHLAVAAALRRDTPATVDGRLANALLLALSNHQARALSALESLAEGSDAVTAWKSALRLHITQDWRAIAMPAQATLIEKQAYFRARRATVARSTAREDLERLNVTESIDWLRTVQASAMSVDDGWLMSQALQRERDESLDVFRQIHGHEMAEESGEPLNARAGRCLDNGTPRVLPWGAWAEFSQRHVAMYVYRVDNFYRQSLGLPERADGNKPKLARELGKLRMFPMATIFWTKGPHGGDADLQYINEGISAAVQSPERIPSQVWWLLEDGANYEPVRHGMPPRTAWYMSLGARAPYDADVRVRDVGPPRSADAFAALLRDAPFDYGLTNEFLRLKYGEAPPYAEIVNVFKPRLDYDLRVLRLASRSAPEGEERTKVLRTACSVAGAECIGLARELARLNRADAAAVEYERAFADPSTDEVTMANNSGWLAAHYVSRGRTDAALALAERAGRTGSQRGLVTQATTYERLQRFTEAEQAYQRIAERYDSPHELTGFYYRIINGRKQGQYQASLDERLRALFPEGLVKVAAIQAPPAKGVIVTKDSELSRAAGLQAGDIIIGLEGWRVENLSQYRTINAFSDNETMTIAVWRGRTFDVTVTAPNRLMGIEFRSYPIAGWAED